MSKTSITAEVLTAVAAQYALSRLLSRACSYAETRETEDLCGHPEHASRMQPDPVRLVPAQFSAIPAPAR
jgi:hypothetical protein